MTLDQKADIFEALENVKKWDVIYSALLRTTKTKKEALEALLYLIEIEGDL